MMRGARPSAPDTLSAATDPGSSPSHSPASRALRLGCVALAGLFLANCANDQVARRGKSKEIGAFPQAKYGPASPRVVAEGQEVPKGGGRQMIGKTYSVAGKRYTPYDKPVGYSVVGTASWYGEAFHGRKTANGEVYDRHGISAAHPTMPLPAYARVTNMLNNRSIIVRVNDRGPYHGGRVMDVSQKTAEALAFRHLGTARIKLEYLGQASLAGSDDRLLLATLRTDGQPAAIPGTSARTMVASSTPVATARSQSADLDDQPAELAPEPARAPRSPLRPSPRPMRRRASPRPPPSPFARFRRPRRWPPAWSRPLAFRSAAHRCRPAAPSISTPSPMPPPRSRCRPCCGRRCRRAAPPSPACSRRPSAPRPSASRPLIRSTRRSCRRPCSRSPAADAFAP
ncbi:septal ring lytic transglycosylase RlpA family protein [Bosea sp. RAC05]|uniref:septal ring lytic transglycosylase RlpA family protein n=1 Tax=Bosea sp. RAC05 TaxID=1842539 RepID=UPI000B2CE47F|nr:septal ring lytic transglycosylase RlpA family protein [Bosea sp. RAC05]